MSKCVVEGNILRPCTTLDKSMAPEANSRAKGITQFDLRNKTTMEVSKSFAVLRSGDLPKNGVVMNYCPFCGESIAHHVQAKEVARDE